MKPAAIRNFKTEFKNTFADYDYTELKSVVGYTLREQYPARIIKRLHIDDNYEYVAFLNFYVDEKNPVEGPHKKYIRFVVSAEITLKAEDKLDDEGPYHYYLDESHMSPKPLSKPIGIRTNEDYVIDPTTGALYRNKKGKLSKTSLAQIHKEIFRLHTADFRTITGIRAQLKLFFFRTLPVRMLNFLSHVLGGLMWVINGQYFTYDPMLEAFTEEAERYDKKEEPKPDPDKQIDFFGYKVSVWTIFTYSLIVVLIQFVFSYFKIKAFDWLGPLEIQTIAFAIVTIITYDKILPRLIKIIVRILGNKSSSYMFKGIKLRI